MGEAGRVRETKRVISEEGIIAGSERRAVDAPAVKL